MAFLKVVKKLSIHYNNLYRWINKYEEYGKSTFPSHRSTLYSYQYEIKKLKAENLELRKELEMYRNPHLLEEENIIPCRFHRYFSRKLVGWSMNTRTKDQLVIAAFNQTYGNEHPEPGLIVHTDEGALFTSGNFEMFLKARKAIHSENKKGKPYANNLTE